MLAHTCRKTCQQVSCYTVCKKYFSSRALSFILFILSSKAHYFIFIEFNQPLFSMLLALLLSYLNIFKIKLMNTFSPINFIVSALTFRSLIYFYFFVHCLIKEFKFILAHMSITHFRIHGCNPKYLHIKVKYPHKK